MKAYSARLSLAENVKKFVSIVNRHPYEVDVRGGRHVVDGRSVFGVLSLNLSNRLTIEVYSDDCEDMEREILPFLIG